ncbi:pentapeptide repeat-containing protein [Amycolatopsis roodepoortensis]|uniref:pentapeptide repeat-containing protein n=1 Tax=Amycolatopsis roodepoortensis TaxID=700274 RepID=UPI00214ACFED|nr:pentapeptide repeat-containing protein [Amycolatopsis roodepoortensis]UUV33201.1 pentapeptide repeat-containing protein [Amycolatopsis roodepoortensis]
MVDDSHSPETSRTRPIATSEGTHRTLSNRTIALCAGLLLLFAVAACWVLFFLYGKGTDADKARLEGVRTVGTIVLGAGGAIALLLAARRQQTAEQDLITKRHDLQLREQANDDARHDAAERRISDLYLKAVEQLGADKAPVRLAGLYALDRLAQDNPSQRQTIVNVISAYLRMPYELPGKPPDPSAEKEIHDEYRSEIQEREVRTTAQRILADHLDPNYQDGKRFWPDIDLDLSGALLIDVMLRDCRLNNARFSNARFCGDTLLMGIHFDGETRFDGVTFTGDSWFSEARFTGNVRFDQANFEAMARFDAATFKGTATFRSATFLREARFTNTTFTGSVVFSKATFSDSATFDDATFFEDAYLPGVTFAHRSYFTEAAFAGDAWFNQVTFSSYTTFDGATFSGDIRFTDSTLDGVPFVPSQLRPHKPLEDE